MTRPNALRVFQPSAVALAVLMAILPAHAQVKPMEATITVGGGLLSDSGGDRALFGQYYGLDSDRNWMGTLDIDYALRKEDHSAWIDFQGNNLLGDSRDLNLLWKVPGDWRLTAEYSELVHTDPNQINTGTVGFGSTTPQWVALAAGPGTGINHDLQTKRTRLGIGFSKFVSPRLEVAFDLKTENKKGERHFGVGMSCPTANDPACLGTTAIRAGWASLMLAEPIDANHSQVEARLSYAFEKLRVNLGYYGSFYRNANASIQPTVGGSLYNAVGNLLPVSPGLLAYLNQPVSLSPDNQMHQLDLSGNYYFSPSTHGSFKLAYSRATQDDGFVGVSRTGLGSLGARVDTKLVQLGVTSRPIPKLSLAADVRYQDRDDQTPLANYNLAGTTPYTNFNLSNTRLRAKMQANWQFNSDYRGTLAFDHESIDRDVLTATSAVAGVSVLRQDTDESGVRAELRRRLSENFSGSVTLSHTRRDGSNWLRDNSGVGVTPVANAADPANGLTNAVFMPTLADRERDKIKFFADWMPNKDTSIQFSAESGKDSYSSPSAYGLHDTGMRQLSVDMSYALSFRWQLNGYLTHETQTLNQSRALGYVMAFDNRNTSLGLGFGGKPTNEIELGGSLSFVMDRSRYAQTLDSRADAYSAASLAAAGGLPDIVLRQSVLKLFGKYALDKRSAIRVDFIHQNTHFNDWSWAYNGVPYTYSDGTTVTQQERQSASFIGISYVYQLP
ncbi:MAG: MtrB/PioB family decaheme-associated outer membrane protein [Rhodoferax sp.]|nr:MtrB/PioB family decaheme-associated outer membrane protein [Rhodoferax sp.]